MVALEPSEDCPVHGCPNYNVCPYCGQFRGNRPCKRCLCEQGLIYDVNGTSVVQGDHIDLDFVHIGKGKESFIDCRFVRKLYEGDIVDPIILLDSYRFNLNHNNQRTVCFGLMNKPISSNRIVIDNNSMSRIALQEKRVLRINVFKIDDLGNRI